MTEDELQAFLEKTLPECDRHGLFVEECGDQDVRLRFSLTDGNWTMPALMTLVHTSLRAAAGAEAELSHLAVTVLRAAQQADVIALSRVLRRHRGVVHAEAWLFSHAVVEPVLHATATLALRDPSTSSGQAAGLQARS
jgi:acyl-coenzyme A thioesterase PaaI-like protein